MVELDVCTMTLAGNPTLPSDRGLVSSVNCQPWGTGAPGSSLGVCRAGSRRVCLWLFGRLVADSQAIEKASLFQKQAVESWGWVENSTMPRE